MRRCVSGKIPAGIKDSNIEFFGHENSLFIFHEGKMLPFDQWPEKILIEIEVDMGKNPKAVEALVQAGFEQRLDMIAQYIRCRHSALDNQPDMVKGRMKEPEYTSCNLRGICPYEGKLCQFIAAPHGMLTPREIEVLKLISRGLLDKEIADRLGISPLTVPVYTKNLRDKTGCKNKTELVRFAFSKNLS